MLTAEDEQILPEVNEIQGQGPDEGSIYDKEEIDPDKIEIQDEETTAEAPESVKEPEPESEPEPEAEQRPNALEQRLREQARLAEEQNEQLNRRLYELEKKTALDKAISDSASVERQLEAARERKSTLMEDGNYEAASKLDDEIFDLRTQKQSYDQYRQQIEEHQYQAPQSQVQQLPEAQQAWLERNTWFNQKAGYTAYANDTYDELVSEGMDPNDPKLYDELDRRIGNAQAKPKPRPEAAPQPGMSEAGDSPTKSTRQNTLTQEDLEKMRRWGLDTTDKNVRAEWLRNKLISEQ